MAHSRRVAVPAEVKAAPITKPRPAETRQIIYGRRRVAGVTVFAHRTRERIPLTPTTTLTATVLHQVVAFADHEIDAFEEVWYDDEVVPLESDGAVTPGHNLAGWAWVNKHLGADGQSADPDLIAAAGDKWTSADRLRGVAYLYVRMVMLESKFPNGEPPNITAVIRGAKVFDSRSHSTAYSANVALCLRDYLFNRRFGLKLPALYAAGTVAVTNGSATVTGTGTAFLANAAGGDQFDVVGDGVWTAIASVDSDTQITLAANYAGTTGAGKTYAVSSEMDEAGVVTTADVCDEQVALAAGGSESRYALGGAISLSLTPQRIIDDLADAMAGDAVLTGGAWTLFAGAYVAPTVSLTDADMLAPPAPRARRPLTQLFNRVKAVFVSPDHRWQKIDAPILKSSAYEAEDNGAVADISLWFPLTTSFATVQRIMKIRLERVRRQEGVTLLCTLSAYRLRAGDTFSYTNARVGWTAKVFRVEAIRLATIEGVASAPYLACEIEARATDAAEYTWAAEEAALDALPSVDLPPVYTDEPILHLRVSGLELDNGEAGNTTEFTGSSAKFIWRDNSMVGSSELGAEPGGAGSGERHKLFKDWEVQIWDSAFATLKRTEYVTTPQYGYNIAKNRDDNGGKPERSFGIEVYTRSTDGRRSKEPARRVVTNPPPELPTGFTIEGGDREVVVKDIAPDFGAPDPDRQGLAVWLSQSSGFTPDNTTLVYQGAISTVTITTLADTQYYLRLAFFDAFGLDGLNLSAEQSVLTGSDLNVTLTDEATVAWDLSAATFAVVTLTADRALAVSSLRAGTFILKVVQGSGGGHALSYPGAVKFPGGSAPDHSIGEAGNVDIVTFVSDGVNFYAVAQKDFS